MNSEVSLCQNPVEPPETEREWATWERPRLDCNKPRQPPPGISSIWSWVSGQASRLRSRESHLKIAVHSNVYSAIDGGGVLYIASLAAALAQKHQVELLFPARIDSAELERLLPVSLSGIQTDGITGPTGLSLFSEIREILTNRRYDMVVTQSTQIPRLHHAGKSILVCEFPLQKTSRLSERMRLRVFRSIITNSSYTASWIEKRWGRKADVLHPPVFPMMPLNKEPWILSVGRFVGGKRSKCQLEMVQMFRELVAAGLQGWQLHIAGMVQDEEYCRRVQEEAAGLPVILHLGVSRPELELLYGQASLFWHASGVRCDPEKEPEGLEHFGIATAEAMSAGTIPIVINRGGQPEIIGESNGGVLWNTFEECKEATWNLIHDSSKRDQMAGRATERAKVFQFPNFAKRVDEIFEGM